ncbi:MAG TPA: malectin domain-containing carbohydrate-binding protein [Bryobacteraceae bacterium]|nr:malectin domain-containing carbohydrate-binding protein [Bryobacteraceae bacterium]
MGNASRILKAIFVASIVIAAASAQTGTLNVYFSPPSAQSTSVPGAITETFDQLPAGVKTAAYVSTTGVGTYTGSSKNPFAILSPSAFGGAIGAGSSSLTNYLAVGNATNSTSPVILTLAQPASYFGFWSSAGSPSSHVDLYRGSTLYASFSTQDLLNFLGNGSGTVTALDGSTKYQTSAYFGNPNIPLGGDRAQGQPFVYVNFQITGATIDTLAFYSASTSSDFATDNHSVIFNGNAVAIPRTFVSVETVSLAPIVAAPTFTPAAGTYTSPQAVTISSATPGSTIRYTTNGSAPSETVGTVYTGPVTVNSTETINAIAYATGMRDSAVVSAPYTLNLPAVTAMSVGSGQQGQVLTEVTITGQFTHFGPGSTVTFANPGITASNIAMTDATHLTATLTIASGAAIGLSNVTVATGGEVATGVNVFTVTPGTPAITAIGAVAVQQGQVLPGVTITGRFTHFGSASTVTFSNPGITASNISVTDPTHLTATLAISASAATGAANVTVTTSSEVVTGANLFTVTPGTPALTALSPNSGLAGQVLTAVRVTGQFTHFSSGSTVTFSNPGITASSVFVADVTHLTATLTIAAGAATGASSVTVSTGAEVVTGASLFTVGAAAAPTITAINPSNGQSGQVLNGVIITGLSTHFAPGSTVTFSNSGITASSVSVIDATHLTATLAIAAGAAAGISNVTVTTGTEIATGTNLFTVGAAATPTITAMSPSSGQPGQVLTGVTITGQFTHFAAGSTLSFSNPAVTAGAISITDATHLTATLTIAAAASPGASNVTVTTGSEIAGGTNLFTINAGTPTLTAISPASGLQGQVLTGVKIAGQFTHFASGSTVTFNNPAITASAISVTDATHLTATVTIGAGAATGGVNVAVTTGKEAALGTNIFTVNAGTPIVSSISPSRGLPGQVLTGVKIMGQFTHFASGSTLAFSNAGIKASNISVTDATHLTATLTLALTASGLSNVTVSTSGEVAAGSNLFSVTPTATDNSCPTSAYSHVRGIVIDHTKVANTDQANFPVLITGTYSYLATTANGGQVQSANGYDIVFSTDLAATQLLNFDRASYNPATGAVAFWVQIPNLSHTGDTVIYLSYGNSSVTSSLANPAAVWSPSTDVSGTPNANFHGVYHLVESAGPYADSTKYGNTSTAALSSYPTIVTGPWSTAQSFSSGQGIRLTQALLNGNGFTNSTASFSYWMKSSGQSGGDGYGAAIDNRGGFGNPGLTSGIRSNGSTTLYRNNSGSGASVDSPSALTDGNWHLVHATLDGTSGILYVDGAAVGTTPGYTNNFSSSVYTSLGVDTQGNNEYLNTVLIAEAHITQTKLSPDWIATEFNNQKSPSTFYTIYGENQINLSVAPATALLYASQTQQFTVTTIGNCPGGVTWSTPSAGTISATGLYTAPSSISTQQTVTLTATSQVDTSKTVTATVTLYPPLTVTVSPLTATLTAGQTQQFTATVANASNPAVTWSIAQGAPGSISASGLYTAPASIGSLQLVAVTATSVADTTKSSTVTVTLQPPTFSPLRINSGGGSFTDSLGRVWAADSGFSGGCPFGGTTTAFLNPSGLDGEYSDARGCFGGIFQGLSYQFNVPNQSYLVTLKFADPQYAAAGQRVFGVTINGTTVLNNVDVAANAGGQYKPWDTSPIPVTVTNGQINIGFTNNVSLPIVSAIEIVQTNTVEVLPYTPVLAERQTQQFLAFVPGAASQAVTWSLAAGSPGTISSTGLYVAPTSIAANTSVTVIATSVANNALVGTSIISLLATDPNTVSPLRINSGGPAVTDPAGRVWAADSGASVGCPFGSTSTSFTPPAGLDVEYADVTGCFGGIFQGMSYRFTVPDMSYLLTLKFADPSIATAQQRVFTVSVNGSTYLAGVDVAAAAGGSLKAYDQTIPVNIAGGQLNIGFAIPPVSNTLAPPIVNAIQLLPVGEVELSPSTTNLWSGQTQQFSGRVADPSNAGLTWAISPNVGSINAATGLYTAPATITSAQTVTVTATGVSNPNWTQSATVTLYPPSTVSVTPPTASLSGGQTQQFTATLTNNAGLGVTWTITPAGMGSITSAGLYTAPPSVFTPQTVTVTATSLADGHTTTASIQLTPTVTVSVNPGTVTLGPSQLQQFRAVVSGAFNNAVTWSISPSLGSINASGLYIAPASIASTTTVTATATSVLSSTASGTATVTLSPSSTGITVSVSPSTASIQTGGTQQFTASVTGTSNTAVTWMVDPPVGTITSTGLYIAPGNIAAPLSVTVQAISVASPVNLGSASVQLSTASLNSYSYRRPIVINHTQVPNSDQSNYTLLVTGTYPYLATTANGGKVTSSSGFDIIFTSDCAGLQKLDHEITSYNPATGAVAMWVVVPLVSHTEDTVLYLSYGDSAVTTSQENRSSVDATRSASHSSDYQATLANNQNSPSVFYLIYPENANTIAPSTVTLAAGQTQQFTPLFMMGESPSRLNPLVLLGSVQTPSPAESLALNGNTVYVCDDNEVSIIDVTHPASPNFLTTALSNTIHNSGNINCSIQQNSLVSFSDAVNSVINGSPAITAFSLTTPTAPQLIAGTAFNRRFFEEPSYVGNIAFVPTGLYQYSVGTLGAAYGQLFSVDLTNLSSPTMVGTLLQPDNSGIGPNNGYIFGGTLYNSQTMYLAGTTSTDGFNAWNQGTGKLLVADISNPASMNVVKEVDIPGTVNLYPPQVQGNLAVALGDNGGIDIFFHNPPIPNQGSIVVTTFDLTNPRSPAVIASTATSYQPGLGGGAAQIGTNLFVFGGVRDSAGNNVLLLVDTSNPRNPVLTSYPVVAGITRLVAAGNILHATLGAAGYAIYQIPGLTATEQTLSGSCNAPVTFSMNPASGQGNVTASGLYTAPTTVAGQTVTVTAASLGDATQTASASVTLSNANCPPSTYSHVRGIVIDHTKVANTDQTNFPVLITGTYPYLATAANGGLVQNSNGYDIIFSKDYQGTQILNFDLASYNPVTGAVAFWVLIPNLSHAGDTVIYLSYGNPAITSSLANPGGVWSPVADVSGTPNTNFHGVYHLAETAGPYADSSKYANNSTAALNAYPTRVTGPWSFAQSFSTGQGIRLTQSILNGNGFDNRTATYSYWIKSSGQSGGDGYGWAIDNRGGFLAPGVASGLRSNGSADLFRNNGNFGAEFDTTTPVTDGNWHLIHGTIDNSGGTLYVDGVAVGTTPGFTNAFTSSVYTSLGVDTQGNNEYLNTAQIAEAHIAQTKLSPDWITTEYNNQKSPSTFYTIFGENQVNVSIAPATASLYASQTQQFTATTIGQCLGGVNWSTPSAGIIASSGLYTAPSSIAAQQSVTLTATSQLDSSKTATAAVTLLPPVTVSVSPQTANVTSGQTLQLTANEQNATMPGVTWSVSPATLGTITTAGLFTASTVFVPQTATVTATTIQGAATGSATLSVLPAVRITISPSGSVTLGPSELLQFTASATGAVNTALTWSVSPSLGSISANGLYTAPSSISSSSTVTVTATSVVNPSATASVTVTLAPAASGITISISPTTASVQTGGTQQFTASVTGTGNTAVTWSVVPPVGTINSSGLYIAPGTISGPVSVTVQAVSAASASNFGTATIQLSTASLNSYSYRRPIVINHGQVANSDQSSYTLLFTGTYPYLATTANNGKVTSTSGFDIIFTSDCAGLQKLDHEITSYNPATGAVSMWVVLPLVSHTQDTVLYLNYGNANVTTSQENRPSVDAARAASHSSDYTATLANNQNSPSTFYTIYPENANSVAPSTATLAAGQTQQFTPLFLVGASPSRQNPLTLLGTLQTVSPAESLALNGNTLYVCDDNEVSIIDVTNPASPSLLTTALSSTIKNAGNIHCSIQQNSLVAFSDALNTQINGSPAITAFSLTNPQSPQLIAGTAFNRRFFEEPSYVGNIAFVPTGLYQYGFGTLNAAYGQLFSVDLTNLSTPTLVGTLLTPDNSGIGPNTGYISGGTLYNSQTMYLAGSTSTDGFDNWNAGVGKLLVADISNPASMSLVKEVDIPGTVNLYKPQVQGNLAVALGDNGGINIFFNNPPIPNQGNIVVTTFDLTNPRNPVVIASIATTYTPGLGGGAAQIGTNLFAFGGVMDSAGNNVLLLVDTTDPQNPVLASYPVATAITQLVLAGNILHATVGAAGYAAYQVPGLTALEGTLTGACNAPVSWSLIPASGRGTISASGLYTAPASISGPSVLTVTATSLADPTQLASSTVALSNALTVTMSAVTPAPFVVGGPAVFKAVVASGNNAISGASVTLTITGANAQTLTGTTDATGTATFTYTGTVRGADTLQASTTANGGATSGTLPVFWLHPTNSMTTTTASARFFTSTSCASGCEAFGIATTATPVFTQSFPDIQFLNNQRPFTDTVLDNSGNAAGAVTAQGSGSQAGVGTLAGFSGVFTGSLVVTAAGQYTLNVMSQDGFIFGVGGGATRVSGINVNAPTASIFQGYAVMGANNGPSTNAPVAIVVSFPQAGSYPYEFDYRSGTGGNLSLSMNGVRPLNSLLVTSNANGVTKPVGQQVTFTFQALDETGAAVASLPLTVTVSGANPQTVVRTTDATGTATFSLTGVNVGADFVQAAATVNGQTAISNQGMLTWESAQAPQITVTGDAVLQLPNRGSYTATVTDPAAPAGGTITVNWTQVSGPGTVLFDTPTQTTVHAAYPAPGSYVLQITATDSLGSNFVQVPVTVQPPVTSSQGWIATPLDGAHVTGQVPITVISTETLVSGTLTVSPVSNPNAAVTLNANTTGTGQIGVLDTTTLYNGAYLIVLNATDTTGKTMGSSVYVNVIGDYKPGRVTTTVTDLVVPAPGIPIQISRTYDSLRKSISGDFGYGWTLGVQVQLEVANTQDVTLTINGQRRTFYWTPTSTVNGLFYQPAYTAEPGFFGSLQVPQSNCGLGSQQQLVKTGNIYICAVGYAIYAPSQVQYTDPYGRTYTVDGSGNLNSVKDLAGNTLTVTVGGITGPNGLNVPFLRDTQGRITQITDPLGNMYKYGYDASGNLASITYPNDPGNPTRGGTFTYDPTHLYTGGTDPRGNTLPVLTYDSSGRLASVSDPLNNTWGYNYNLAVGSMTRTNPDGGRTVTTENSYGQPVSITDPLNRTTTIGYDANRDLVSYTNPQGKTTTIAYNASGLLLSVTDPLGNQYSWTYGPNGLKLTETDPLGHTKQLAYDAKGNPTSITDGLGQTIGLTWNSQSLLTSLTMANGAIASFVYDSYGNPISVTDHGGTVDQRQYDPMGRWTGETDAYHGSMAWAYNVIGLLTSTTDPLGHSVTYAYDLNGNRTLEVDKNGGRYTRTYDALNRIIGTTFPDGTSVSANYDYAGRPLTLTDAGGRITSNVYDLAGQLTSSTTAAGTADQATTRLGYDLAGRLVSTTDALGNTTTRAYDDAGRLASVTDALGQKASFVHDAKGRTTSQIAADGAVTSYAYDERGRMTQVTKPDGSKIALAYGPLNLQTKTDELGRTTQYAYNGLTRPTSVTDANNNIFTYAWGPTGNLTSVVDPNGHITLYSYDAGDRLIKRTLPDGSNEQYSYDADGNVTSVTLTDGHVDHFSNDGAGRLNLATYFDGSTVAITYTATGKRQSVASSAGTSQYQYDNRDRLVKYTQADGQVITYTYDSNSNVLTRTTPAGIITFGYDKLNRCVSVSDVPHGNVAFTYDSNGRILTVGLPNGIVTNYSYDPVGRVSHVGHSIGSAPPFQSFDYLFDTVGNRLQATEADGSQTKWAYDAVYQVTQETVVAPGGATTRNSVFTYDPAGNITTRTDNGVGITFQYNNLDQLLAVGTKTYTYDLRGNLASTTDASGVTTLTFDSANRLATVVLPVGAGSASYTYDGENRRIAQTVTGSTSQFLWDPMSGVGDVVMEANGPSILASYNFGPSGVLWRAAGLSTSFYLHDGLGSTIGLTDLTGKLTDQYRYDAYGQRTLSVGSTTNPLQYRGQWTDPLTGFQNLRSRYYNPGVGRFLSRDQAGFELGSPIDFNRYRYAASNPVNASDPLGHQAAIDYKFLNWALQNQAVVAEYGAAQEAEAAAAATADQFADTTLVEWVHALAAGLPGIAGTALGDAAGWITLSSGEGITDAWWAELATLEAGGPTARQYIASAYLKQPRKIFAAISGEAPNDSGQQDGQKVLAELQKAFPLAVVGDALITAFWGEADKCVRHAEQKVITEAEASNYTILGIGASRDICIPCQARIRGHNPFAIYRPIGTSAKCIQ